MSEEQEQYTYIYNYYLNWDSSDWNYNNFIWNYLNSTSSEKIQEMLKSNNLSENLLEELNELKDIHSPDELTVPPDESLPEESVDLQLLANMFKDLISPHYDKENVINWLKETSIVASDNYIDFVEKLKTYPPKMILFIHAHGKFEKTFTLSDKYIIDVKIAMQSSYGTCSYSSTGVSNFMLTSIQNQYIHHYLPDNNTFNIMRYKLRAPTFKQIEHIKSELTRDALPFAEQQTKRLANIQHIIDVERTHESIEPDITGMRHYWVSYKIQKEQVIGDKTYTFEDITMKNMGIYVAYTSGLTGMQIQENSYNKFFDVIDNSVQQSGKENLISLFNILKQRGAIQLSTIIILLNGLGINAEIFDSSCNVIKDTNFDQSASNIYPPGLIRNPSTQGGSRNKLKRKLRKS